MIQTACPFIPLYLNAIASSADPAAAGDVIGRLAGLSASVLWVFTALAFTAAGRRIGPTAVNTLRLCFAIVLLSTAYLITSQGQLPDVRLKQVLLLAASGLIGLTICDQFLYTAFLRIGPRLTLLLQTLSPLFALAFGLGFLDERITPLATLGIATTIGGVAWVVLERHDNGASPTNNTREHTSRFRTGVAMAIAAAALQAAGAWLSKAGMGHGWLDPQLHLDTLPAATLRVIFGGLGMTPIVALYVWRRNDPRRILGRSERVGTRRAGIAYTAIGAVLGPCLGMWASLVAFDRAPIGVAQTLMSLSPVLILPIVILVYKERVSPRAAIGAAIAVAGSALLFLAN